MREFTTVITPENQPYFPFFHLEKEYLIYCWVDDDKDVLNMVLAEPKDNGGSYGVNNLIIEYAAARRVTEVGGIKALMNECALPKFNGYLAEQGDPVDGGFPIDKKDFEQFNWVIENALSYVDGKVVMADF